MELAVVSHSGTASTDIARVADRLAAQRWAAAYAEEVCVEAACQLGERLGVTVTSTAEVDPAKVIQGHPGQQVVMVCRATTIQKLVASVLEVALELVPLPAELSLTRVRASRHGTRNLVCLNDSLHLNRVVAADSPGSALSGRPMT